MSYETPTPKTRFPNGSMMLDLIIEQFTHEETGLESTSTERGLGFWAACPSQRVGSRHAPSRNDAAGEPRGLLAPVGLAGLLHKRSCAIRICQKHTYIYIYIYVQLRRHNFKQLVAKSPAWRPCTNTHKWL